MAVSDGVSPSPKGGGDRGSRLGPPINPPLDVMYYSVQRVFCFIVFMTLVARRLMSAACILMWMFRANTAKYEIASVALQPSKSGRNSFADKSRIAGDTNLHKRVFGKAANMAAFWISRSENRHYLNRFGRGRRGKTDPWGMMDLSFIQRIRYLVGANMTTVELLLMNIHDVLFGNGSKRVVDIVGSKSCISLILM